MACSTGDAICVSSVFARGRVATQVFMLRDGAIGTLPLQRGQKEEGPCISVFHGVQIHSSSSSTAVGVVCGGCALSWLLAARAWGSSSARKSAFPRLLLVQPCPRPISQGLLDDRSPAIFLSSSFPLRRCI